MVELHIKIRKRIARLAYGENFVSYNEGYKIIFDRDFAIFFHVKYDFFFPIDSYYPRKILLLTFGFFF